MKSFLLPAWHGVAIAALLLHAGLAVACSVLPHDPVRPLNLVQQKVNLLLHKRDFKQLDQLAIAYRSPDALSTDGQSMLLGFYGAFALKKCAAGGAEVEAKAEAEARIHRKLLEEWKMRSTAPEVATIALAAMELATAWRKRGGGYIDSVTPDGLRQFREHLTIAADMLDGLAPAARKDPHWYATRLGLALAQGWNAARFDGLFKEAIGAFPYYTDLYHTRARYYTARWHGSRAKFNAVVNEAEASPANKRGPKVLFVRLHSGEWPRDKDEQPNFELMRQGFENLIARFPDMYNHNRYAAWACKADAPTILRAQMAIIGTNMSIAIWGTEKYFNECREYGIKVAAAIDNAPVHPGIAATLAK